MHIQNILSDTTRILAYLTYSIRYNKYISYYGTWAWRWTRARRGPRPAGGPGPTGGSGQGGGPRPAGGPGGGPEPGGTMNKKPRVPLPNTGGFLVSTPTVDNFVFYLDKMRGGIPCCVFIQIKWEVTSKFKSQKSENGFPRSGNCPTSAGPPAARRPPTAHMAPCGPAWAP